MSVNTKFDPGESNTGALFWTGGTPTQQTKMFEGVGHEFMTRLVKKFNKTYTWEQQWNSIKSKIAGERLPRQYAYGDFPVTDRVFRVDS